MWLKNDVVASVDAIARIYYIDRNHAKRWNEQRDEGEPRLFTGWCWAGGNRHQGGLKTKSAAYRDAWYQLVARRETPIVRGGTRLRVVKRAAA